MTVSLVAHKLCHENDILFDGSSPTLACTDAGDDDVFLVVHAAKAGSRHVIELGQIPALRRWTLCHRYEPFWMKPKAGTQIKDVPPETQFLLTQLSDDQWLLCVPLIDDPFRFSLRGRDDQTLEILCETGDPFTLGHGGLASYVAHGPDPFALVRRGAQRVAAKLGLGRLRREKRLPDFADDFGWCTWDAFYQDVSAANVQAGLEQFARGGVSPRFVILDDGWQSTATMPTGETRQTDFKPNQKFNGDLQSLVKLAKRDFGVRTFLVWHAIIGYWGGVSGNDLPGYGVVDQIRRFGEGIMAHVPKFNEDWWGSVVGLVGPDAIGRFYDDFHAYLEGQGVDGVKVDNQAVLEAVAHGQGGRVALTRAYRDALESSVERHFRGRLINCMSNGQETWYGSRSSTLIRSSIDYFPRVAESHGLHIYTNAQVGLWFGEFMHPDWDMFQSRHEWGTYHAASRAISGGPIYVSDAPGSHDFELLRKLVCSDGSVLRCDGPGVPTLDSLCADPTAGHALLKIWNRNGRAGIVGVFNGSTAPGARPVTTVSPSDVPLLQGERFACYAHVARELTLPAANEQRTISLGSREFELFTFVPIENHFAPIGLVDKFNSAGAVVELSWPSETACELTLRDAGRFLAYSRIRPASIQVEGVETKFEFDPEAQALRVDVAGHGRCNLKLLWSDR